MVVVVRRGCCVPVESGADQTVVVVVSVTVSAWVEWSVVVVVAEARAVLSTDWVEVVWLCDCDWVCCCVAVLTDLQATRVTVQRAKIYKSFLIGQNYLNGSTNYRWAYSVVASKHGQALGAKSRWLWMAAVG